MQQLYQPILIGTIVTDRPLELHLLLESLAPLADDPHVHLLVLDNGANAAAGAHHVADVLSQVTTAQTLSAGARVVVRSPEPRQPLHQSRRVLSAHLQNMAATLAPDTLIWIIDDDVRFEELCVVQGRLLSRSVAVERIHQLRELFERHAELDVLVSGFTGDPPIRPEAILNGQLIDLAAALKLAATLRPSDIWPTQRTPWRTYEDYYDHREPSNDDAHQPRAWVPRDDILGDANTQLTALLQASAGIVRGCTPFRPLIAGDDTTFAFVARANRGGNTIFKNHHIMAAHPYPAWQLSTGRFTRRADMIGLSCLQRRDGVRLAIGGLTLLHDRRHQGRVSGAVEDWTTEFAGVLISRAFDRAEPGASTLSFIQHLAALRCDRIIEALKRASINLEESIRALSGGPWRQSHIEAQQLAARALTEELEALRAPLQRLLDGRLMAALRDPALAQLAADAVDQLYRGDIP
jgi:hypothetical protein